MNFFAGPGSWNFSKITKSLYSKYEPKIHRNYQKCCSERELRVSWWFWVKTFFGKISNFWTFLQVQGHEIFQKLLGPYIQNASLKLTKTTQNVVRNVYLDFLIGFEKKKIFWKNLKFLNFFAGLGSWNFSKMTKSLYSKYQPKIHRNYPKCCSERKLRLSWWFRVKKFFGKISNFWTFLQVRGHEIFQKSLGPYIQNTSLKLTGTTQNVVQNGN